MLRRATTLDYAILGLIGDKALTGYEVRKVFRETPLGAYSDSPGSIYPALRRLEARGLIAGTSARGGRHARRLSLTAKGRTAISTWVTAPLTREEVVGRGATPELRLSFLSGYASTATVRAFIRRFGELLEAEYASAAAARDTLAPLLSTSARLALDLGLATRRARAAWLRRAARIPFSK
jgi:DNA-binding PadR family transcriptional regulator